ncbi:UNVERIFIED_CONTAM: hypothetical protein RMT77_012657 [Armadillidium vulgare]
MDDKCFAFAHSSFAMVCKLYEYTLGAAPVIDHLFTLYITKRSEKDGFFIFRSFYIKIFTHGTTAYNGQKVCEQFTKGTLVEIKDEEMNEFVGGLMLDMYLFEAFIGITDEKVEGKWTFMDDGAPVKFFQWNFKGQWHRRDKNCASIMLAKYQWRQYNCRDHLPFICQIPFY